MAASNRPRQTRDRPRPPATSWKIFSDFFGSEAQTSPTSSLSSTSLQSTDQSEFVFDTCRCCGSVIKYPASVQKCRCVFCGTTFVTANYDPCTPTHGLRTLAVRSDPVSFTEIKESADKCFLQFKKSVDSGVSDAIKQFRPLEDLLYRCFSSAECLNNSFKLPSTKKFSHTSSHINFKELYETFRLLLLLPVKRPFFVLLSAASTLLQNPPNIEFPDQIYFLLILLELPTLGPALLPLRHSRHFFDSHEVRMVSTTIVEHAIGLTANLPASCSEYVVNWFSRLSEPEFRRKIDFANLYITHILRGLLAKHHPRPEQEPHSPELRAGEMPRSPEKTPPSVLAWSKRSRKNRPFQLSVKQYGSNWRLRTGAKYLALFHEAANSGKLEFSLDTSIFYNSLVDMVNIRQDFDAWQTASGMRSTTKTELTIGDTLITVGDYLASAEKAPLSPIVPTATGPSFAFCQYPFLLSLAAKISVIEYEARRQMLKKAEEAFLHAVNRKTIVEVYFKVRVRRNHITNDSLRCIKENLGGLKKSLKVEFIGEPGIDAGGLKKEWFLLLTKKLFDPDNGLFSSLDSGYLWFSLGAGSPENSELYHLVGVVLGLAMYNSTILDLRFPPALYKLLLDKPVGMQDFDVVFPETAANLRKLVQYDGDDFDAVFEGFYCELTYKTFLGEVKTTNLLPNGSKIPVTRENRREYVRKYAQFYLVDGIKEQVEAFKTGFRRVISGNAYSLFSPQEIELLLCGSDESNRKYDLASLKTVTKYTGFLESSPESSPLVRWFWEFFEELSVLQQRKLMIFITGSDRVPATGIVSMNFKVTHLGKKSNRLPIAHTCFNEICLYGYETKEKLSTKLSLAMNESEGFGIK